MKIAITCPASLPATPFGGILMVSVNFARRLSSLDHEVTIYTSNLNFAGSNIIFDKNLSAVEKMEGFTIKRCNPIFRVFMFLVTPQIYNLIKKDKPELIHAFGCRAFQSFIAALVSKFHKIPLIVSDYGGITTHPDITSGSFLKKIFYRLQNPLISFVINQASRVIAANEYELQDFLHFTTNKKITILPTGIDSDSLQRVPFDFKVRYNLKGRIILFVGRFNKVKGIDMLLKAHSNLCKDSRFSDVTLLIMGSNFGFENEMKKMISDLKIGNRLKIIQNPKRDEVIAAYHACEFLVLPSRWELSPLTPLEGFACKKTVISTDVAGVPHVIENGKNGILTAFENVDELFNAIVNLLNNKTQATMMGENGYQLVKSKFDSKLIQNNLLKIYDEVLTSS